MAVKVLDKTEMSRKEIDHAMTEIAILKACRGSPHIVALLDTFEDSHHLYLVMEYLSGNFSLLKLVRSGGLKSEEVVKKMSKQLFKGLEYLHKRGVAHRDIKHDNIMVAVDAANEMVTFKLIDFGFSRVLVNGESDL